MEKTYIAEDVELVRPRIVFSYKFSMSVKGLYTEAYFLMYNTMSLHSKRSNLMFSSLKTTDLINHNYQQYCK